MTQKLVNGELVDLTPEEEAQREAEYLAEQAQAEKNRILSDIYALEASVTPRRQREAILAIDTTWLADVELQIGQLRQQLAEYDNA
jgi:hypothetical protein